MTPRRYVPAAFAVLALATTIWFFVSSDKRGATARLQADAEYYHLYLPSVLFDGDVDFTDEYRITQNWYRFGRTRIGRPSNVFGVGPATFELPFFAVGHVLARLQGVKADGFSRPEVKTSLFASLVYTLGAAFFAWRLLQRRLGSPAIALAAAAVVAAASPVVYYAIRQPGYAHPFATFFTAAFLDAWDASFERPRGLRTWIVMGALLGAAALARPQLVFWGVVLLPAVWQDVRARRWRALPPIAAGAGAAIVAFLPQMLAWRGIYGAWLTVPQGPGFMRWDAPAWSEVLFASRNGLFAWAPLTALAFVGLVASARRTPRPALAMLAGVALQVVANGAVWDWWAGGSFGGRRFDSCYLPFAYGLAFLAGWTPPRLARVWQVAVGVVALILTVNNLAYAGITSGPSARIYGGEAPATILRAAGPPGVGAIAAACSQAVTFPARALFALRHGTGLSVYDRVVGVHLLGELYPGLNSIPPKLVENIPLRPGQPFLVGFEATRGGMRMRGGRASVLVNLNRRHGPIALTVRFREPTAARVAWNGREVAASPAPVPLLAGELAELARGVNTLTFDAPAGTIVGSFQLEVRPGTPP